MRITQPRPIADGVDLLHFMTATLSCELRGHLVEWVELIHFFSCFDFVSMSMLPSGANKQWAHSRAFSEIERGTGMMDDLFTIATRLAMEKENFAKQTPRKTTS